MKIYFYNTNQRINNDTMKSMKNFKRAKFNFEKEIKTRKEKINELKNVDEILHESFIFALSNYKEKENSNFNFLFSSEVSKRLVNRKKNDEIKVDYPEEISIEEKIDLKKINKIIIKELRKMKGHAKFYFSLRYSIYFEKPIDDYEDKSNIFNKRDLTFSEIETLGNILFDKKRTRQGVEQSVQRTREKIKKYFEKNEELKKILNRN